MFVKINQNLELNLYDDEGVLIEAVQDAGDGLGGGVAADFMISKDLAVGTYYVSIGGDENISNLDYNLESEFQEKIIDLDPESAGSYYGLVKNEGGILVGHLTITVTENGYYSGQLKGSAGFKRFFNGEIQPNYSASNPVNAYKKDSTLVFQLEKAASGYYRLTGNIQPLVDNGKYQSFGLFKAVYGNAKRVPRKLRGRYTMLAPFPTTSDSDLPAGDVFACGALHRVGQFKLYGYSSSGSKFSYASPVLETNKVPFFTRPDGFRETLLGDVRFRNKETSDFWGRIRYTRKTTNGAYYSDKFVKSLRFEGSRYRRPGTDELPLNSFGIAENNAVAEFVGGVFDGGRYSLTWNADGSMETPSTSLYRASATFNNKNGQFSGEYVVTPSVEGSPEVTTYLRGVVLQKKGIVSGHAETENSGVGRYSIIPAP